MSASNTFRLACVLVSLFAFAPPQALLAQEGEDVFAFIPDGGRTLLQGLIDNGLSPDIQAEITGQSRDAGGWAAFLAEKSADNPLIAELDEYEAQTLASYLSYNMPLEAGAELPWDGRDMALARCQSCHIITVVVTQDREREHWLGTMHTPSHIEVPLTEPEREALADYLVLNAGIPIDEIPPALRAGGASY
jgi:hypothetical protein